jgi:cold shock CspA family protein/ribosome-associated translation inhibitor RaiA
MERIPVQITARGLELAVWWKEEIQAKVEKLRSFHRRITACRVVVESIHHHHHKGRLYSVRVALEVPGRLIVVDREAAPTLGEAIELSFDAAGRRLEDFARRRRGDVKRRVRPPEGRVSELFPEAGYGFLETEDGRSVYFHRHSVLGGLFDRLTRGSRVRFVEEQGEKGPQASTVSIAKLAPRAERRRRRGARRAAAA